MSLSGVLLADVPEKGRAAVSDPKGFHLFVNLSASETRRRLQGYGHGVRKIHSGGKNQAVVIHTATGEHLQELEAKFADVGCWSDLPDD